VSDVASIFRVEVRQVVRFSVYRGSCLEETTRREEEGESGASSGPIGTVELGSCVALLRVTDWTPPPKKKPHRQLMSPDGRPSKCSPPDPRVDFSDYGTVGVILRVLTSCKLQKARFFGGLLCQVVSQATEQQKHAAGSPEDSVVHSHCRENMNPHIHRNSHISYFHPEDRRSVHL
jgi:hypothetical protein